MRLYKNNTKYVNDIDINIILLLSLVIAMSLNNHFVFIYEKDFIIYLATNL